MSLLSPSSPIIVALDVDSRRAALELARQLDPSVCRVKVGKELFTAVGPAILDDLRGLGFEIFLDLKFHDIPATVAKAVQVAADLGVWMLNVHASGGSKMLREASEVAAAHPSKPLLIAVTVLTSMSQAEYTEIGGQNISDQALALARLSAQAGLAGVVCSAQEARRLKRALGEDFILVTPGIRPAGATLYDQARVMTPAAALAEGSDYLVVGRPITEAADPAQALREIVADVVQHQSSFQAGGQ